VRTPVATGRVPGRTRPPHSRASVLAAHAAWAAVRRPAPLPTPAATYARGLCPLPAGTRPAAGRHLVTGRAPVARRPQTTRCLRRIATEGYACRTPGCPYAGITDSQVHALVADGHHGRTDHIQDFTYQACGHRVSARWGTALFQLKTPSSRIGEVLSALAEGLSVGAAVRVFGHGEVTITRWRDRAAQHAARLHHLCWPRGSSARGKPRHWPPASRDGASSRCP